MDRHFVYGTAVLVLIAVIGYALKTAIWLFNQPNDIAFILGFALLYLTSWTSLKLFVKIFRKWRNNEDN
jgi:peptidoglycan/LPS O-acetylase OafA/YrhL